jgi:hypothetical protein
MKRFPLKVIVMVLLMMGLVAVAQPALAWVRVGIDVRLPFPVVVAPVAPVVATPVAYARPRPVQYRPVWIPGHYNRWGAWVPGHLR